MTKPEPGKRPSCKAKAKTTGERCRNPSVTGYQVCRMHGANGKNPGGAPSENANAQTHGVYSQVIRGRLSPEEQQLFDQVPTTSDLEGELRINRFKLLRLLEDVEQNFPVGFTVRKIEADELTKIEGIVKLTDSIRKLTKDMHGSDADDPLVEFLDRMTEAREQRKGQKEEE